MKQKQLLILSGSLALALIAGAAFYWLMPKRVSVPVSPSDDSQTSELTATADEQRATKEAADVSVSLMEPIVLAQQVWERPLVDQDDKQITFATLGAKTGEGALIGNTLIDGLVLALNAVNSEKGGIFGNYRLALDQRDDAGVFARGVGHLREQVQTTPFFIGVMGEEVVEKAMLPLIQAGTLALLFPPIGGRPVQQNGALLYFRPSYVDELYALIHYTVTTLKKTKIALFHEESGWGLQARKAAERLLAAHNLTLAGAASYQPGTVNVSAAVKAMSDMAPEVIICAANGRPAYNFIREAVNQKLHYVTFLGTSRLAGIQEHLATARGIKLCTSAVVPNPRTSKLPIVEQYRAAMQKYLPNKGLSPFSLEGYIAMQLLVEFLSKLTPAAQLGHLVSSIQQAGSFDFHGLSLHGAGPSLSRTVWLNEGDGKDWYAYVVPA